MKLEKGAIYRFKYVNYTTDKFPLAIILHSDSQYTHALNLNYLPKQLKEQTIEMIALLATKKLKYFSKDNDLKSYELYHNYIKRQLPKVIRFAYRKYFTHLIRESSKVSSGVFNNKAFIVNLKKASPTDFKKIFTQIKKSVNIASNEEEQDKKLQKLNRLKALSSLTDKQINDIATNYLNDINQIYKQKFDKSKFTF